MVQSQHGSSKSCEECDTCSSQTSNRTSTTPARAIPTTPYCTRLEHFHNYSTRLAAGGTVPQLCTRLAAGTVHNYSTRFSCWNSSTTSTSWNSSTTSTRLAAETVQKLVPDPHFSVQQRAALSDTDWSIYELRTGQFKNV